MRSKIVHNQSRALKKRLLVDYCDSYWCKLIGLAWRRDLDEEQGIVLVAQKASKLESAIHMFGMFFDLTIVWLDSDLHVVDVRLAKRWRSIFVPRKAAQYVIECAHSRFGEFDIGDQIAFEKF